MAAKKGSIPWNKTGKTKECLFCKKTFYATPSDDKIGKAKYCSKNCFDSSRRGVPNTRLSILYKGKKKTWLDKIRPNMVGGKHPNWKGGITPKNTKIRNSEEFILWAKSIKERDNYKCQICGEVGGELRSNHIKKFSDYPELRFEPLNGITICRYCDYRWVFNREPQWESYFNFNLMNRGYING